MPKSSLKTRINLKIDKELGAESGTRTICIGYHRANSKQVHTSKDLEQNIEYYLEHETIHLVLDQLSNDPIYNNIVSWLFDYLDYEPRNIIEYHEIPNKKVLLKPLPNLLSEHKKLRKEYLKNYFGKVVK